MKVIMDKVCPNCGEPFTGKSSKIWCSYSCGSKARGKRRREDNPEYYRLKRLREDANLPNYILSRVRSRAKKLKIECNLEHTDIIVPVVCPVLGIQLKRDKKLIQSPSLDRIDPSLGYVKGNVRVISNRANILKSNATVEELELVLKDLKELQS